MLSLYSCRLDLRDTFSTRYPPVSHHLMTSNAPNTDCAVIIRPHIFHINFKVPLSGGYRHKIIHQKALRNPHLPFEGQNKNVDGWNNCSTSKCRLLVCIYCRDRNAVGCFFFINVSRVGGKSGSFLPWHKSQSNAQH